MSSPEQHTNSHAIIKHDRVRFDDASAEVPSALPSRGNAASPQRNGVRCKKSVQLLREKNIVHGIEVRCSCGEVTLVEIEYGPQPG
ncbi:MAG TPA: hypothetical protein VK843_23370 [Planctomycetota bacterium]|nr:hypothetical protein [Planctomycetota bacterium]